MRKALAPTLGLVLLGLAMVSTAACRTKTPEERIAAQRAKYVANLNGWIVREPPVEEMPMEEAEGDDGAAEGADGAPAGQEGEELVPEGESTDEMAAMEMEPVGPQKRDILLDINIYHSNPEPMPGLTLDVSHADENEAEKERYLVWVDTAGIVKGQHVQVNHVLEGVDFEAGDKFAVEIRSYVPPGEQDAYREFREVE